LLCRRRKHRAERLFSATNMSKQRIKRISRDDEDDDDCVDLYADVERGRKRREKESNERKKNRKLKDRQSRRGKKIDQVAVPVQIRVRCSDAMEKHRFKKSSRRKASLDTPSEKSSRKHQNRQQTSKDSSRSLSFSSERESSSADFVFAEEERTEHQMLSSKSQRILERASSRRELYKSLKTNPRQSSSRHAFVFSAPTLKID